MTESEVEVTKEDEGVEIVASGGRGVARPSLKLLLMEPRGSMLFNVLGQW